MFLTQKKFANLLGISQPAISTAIKRGKVKFTKHGINPEHPTNEKYARETEIRLERKRNRRGVKGSTDAQRRSDEKSDKKHDLSERNIKKIAEEYNSRLVTEANEQGIDLDEVNEQNIQNFAKVDIDKLSIIERTKLSRLRTLKERGKLVDIDNVKTVFTRIMAIEENELKTIPDNVTMQLVGYFGRDDPKVNNEVRKKLEKEIFKVLRRIKDTIGDFLEENKCA